MEKLSHTPQITLAADDPRLAKFCQFTGLGPGEAGELLKLTTTITVPSGKRIVRAGDEGHCLYVLLEGRARVTIDQADHTVELAQLESGDFFGEVALVDDGPRSADVTALEPCTLLGITRMTIGVLAGLQPEAAIQILGAIGRALVKRLRIGNQKYLDILLRAGLSE